MSDEKAAQANTDADKSQGSLLTASAPADKVSADSGNKDPQKAESTETQGKAVVPEKYELKLPENSKLDSSALDEISLFAKEKGLSNEAAQALLERENEVLSRHEQQQQEAYELKKKEWVSAVEGDKEIGGNNLSKSVELAKRVVTRFGTPDFLAALNSTGLGNHPELVRVFARIGGAMSEDQFVMPGASDSGRKKSAAEILYPNHKQN